MNKKYLTPEFVLKYLKQRSDEPIRHCHKALAAACNDISDELDYNKPLDMLKLLCFNDEYLAYIHIATILIQLQAEKLYINYSLITMM